MGVQHLSSMSEVPKASGVDKVAVATKHPGVFVQTSELEAETGTKLPTGIQNDLVQLPAEKGVAEVPMEQGEADEAPQEVAVAEASSVPTVEVDDVKNEEQVKH